MGREGGKANNLKRKLHFNAHATLWYIVKSQCQTGDALLCKNFNTAQPYYTLRKIIYFYFHSQNIHSDFHCILIQTFVVYFNTIEKCTDSDIFSLLTKFSTVFWYMHLLYALILLKNMQTDKNTHTKVHIFFPKRNL